ncbi:hypothetical protein H4R24_005168 [Coemansia sp. RSA 988]|nr:hypothetical protein H4R24_005168 [Coemansia sp. RSA 988]
MSRPADLNNLHTQSTPDFRHREPRTWSVREVASWLRTCAPKGLVPNDIEKHSIDGALLVEGLSYEFLNRNVGLRAGLSLMLMRNVRQLCEKWNITAEGINGSYSLALLPPSASAAYLENSNALEQHYAASDDDDNDSPTSALLAQYIASLAVRSVAPRAISLISASYSGACIDSDSDVLSDGSDTEYAPMDATRALPLSGTDPEDMSAIADNDLFAYDRHKPDEQRMLGSELPERMSESRTGNIIVTSDSVSHMSHTSADADLIIAQPDIDNGISRDSLPVVAAAAAERPRKRIAPLLVTTELFEAPSGNIVDQYSAFEPIDDVGPPTPSLSIRNTCSRIQELFPHAVSQSQAADWWRVRPDFDSVALPYLLATEKLGATGDSFWFWRPSCLRIGIVDTGQGRLQDLHLQSYMLQAQAQYRRFIVGSDSMVSVPAAAAFAYGSDDDADVLPLYGESSDEAELSDGFLREVEQEREEIALRKAKATETEERRVAMVKEVIQEMVEHYARMWHETAQPRMERKAHGLWGRYIGRRQVLLSELADLRDRRLLKAQQSVIGSGVSKRLQTKVLCGGLRATVDEIARVTWLLRLTECPRPLPLPRSLKTRSPRVAADIYPDNDRHGDNNSSSLEDSDGLSGFIDDEDDSGCDKQSVLAKDQPEASAPLEIMPIQPPVPRLSGGRRRRGPRRTNAALSGHSKRAQNTKVCVTNLERKQVLLEECVDSAEHTIPDTDSEAADWSDTGRRQAQRPRLNLSSEELTLLLRQYSANDMYKAIMMYIRSLAVGDPSLEELASDADGGQKPVIGVQLALRLWTEFQNWIVTALPTVRVRYANVRIHDAVQAQLMLLMAEPSDKAAKVEDHDQRAVSLQLGRIASSIIKCPVDRPPATLLQTDSNPERSCNTVDIVTAELPGVLTMLRDGGIAQKTAFVSFYAWRRGTVEAAGSSEMEVFDTSSSSSPSPSIAADGIPQGREQNDSGDLSDLHKRTFSRLGASDESDPEFLLASSNPFGEQQLATSLDPEDEKCVRMDEPSESHRQRRNIRPIRGEMATVLSLRRQQKDMDLAIQRRLEERAASGIDETSAAAAAAAVADDANNNNEEVLASGNMADPTLPSSMSAVNMADIGTPVLINPGHSAEQQDVMIPGFIAGHLKSHQVDGVRFMWKNIVMTSNHSADAASSPQDLKHGALAQHGCVLAHSMGLGKTLQTISLVYTLLNEVHCNSPDFANSIFAARRVLILCPATVQSNWASEFWKWTGVDHSLSRIRKYKALDGPLLPQPLDIPTDRNMTMDERQRLLCTVRAIRLHTKRIITQVINYSLMKNSEARLAALRSWNSHGGVLIMGYVGFRELMQYILSSGATTFGTVAESSTIDESDVLQELRRYMVDEGPSLVIADEGHTIKNPQTKLATYANMLFTKARICLTGYPLQNKLEEYWTMVDFCFSNYLGSLADFRNAYVNPIKNGLYADSTAADKRTSSIRMRTLQKLLETVVDRRDSSILHHQLPRKVEYVISCPLTAMQQELYCRYLAAFLGIGPDGSSSMYLSGNEKLFQHGMLLSTICNHPAVCQKMLEKHRRQMSKANHRDSSSKLAASEHNGTGDMTMLEIEDDSAELADMELKSADAVGDDDVVIANIDGELDKVVHADWCNSIFAQHSQPAVISNGDDNQPIEDIQLPAYSTKVLLMLDIIQQSVKLGERVLVFSRYISTLDYLQWVVEYTGAAAGGSTLSGRSTHKTLRIDGTIPVSRRQQLIDQFNSPASRYSVFFISSGTGSIGINLVAASRVIVFDIGWNPLYDEQAVARVYRYGQKRQVYVYRLLTTDTWEDRLFNNYIFKVGMARCVVDKQTMNRQIAKDDMRKYFQRPAQNIASISADHIANLTQEYRDDFVLATLLAKYAYALARVMPQATLLANEDDNLQIEMEVQAMVLQEQQRLGLISTRHSSPEIASADVAHAISDSTCLPIVEAGTLQQLSQPQISQPSYMPSAPMDIAAADTDGLTSEPICYANGSGSADLPVQKATLPETPNHSASASLGIRSRIDIKNHSLLIAEAMLRAVLLRIKTLTRNAGDNIPRFRVFSGLLQAWLDNILAFIDRGSPGADMRENILMLQILPRIQNQQAFCDIVPALYQMDDGMLLRMLSAGIN